MAVPVVRTGQESKAPTWQASSVNPAHRATDADDLERVSTRAALAARAEPHDTAGTDPWVRWCLPGTLSGAAIVCHDVALIPRTGRFRGFWVHPLAPTSSRTEAQRMRLALHGLADLLPVGEDLRVSLPRAHAALAHGILPVRVRGGDWDWMWTATTPAGGQEGEQRLVELDDLDDAAELIAFTAEHNPRVWAQIGTGTVTHWIGLRDHEDELVAIGGAQREHSGAAHLVGILTHRGLTSQGLGTRITRELTTWAIADGGVSTLGVFSDSAAAIRLYTRLGYRTAAAWHSVSVLKPG